MLEIDPCIYTDYWILESCLIMPFEFNPIMQLLFFLDSNLPAPCFETAFASKVSDVFIKPFVHFTISIQRTEQI